MKTKISGNTFDFDPYKNVRVIENLDNEILIISTQKLKSVLFEAKSSLGRKDLWITPLILLITLIGLFVTTEFKQFIVPADTWRAFFIMLSLLSVLWLIWAVCRSLKSRKVDEILNECMQGSVPITEANNLVPRVVETYPKNDTVIEVPSDGEEILFSVTYNQVMNKGYSWASTENAYPEKINNETPIWSSDGKTCKFKMKVYPNMKYGISFNKRGRFENFKSLIGISAETYVLEFSTLARVNNTSCWDTPV